MLAGAHERTETGRATTPVVEVAGARAKRTMRAPILIFVASLAWYAAAKIALDARATEHDRSALDAGSSLLAARLEWTKKHLRAVSELVADDPRLKTMIGASTAEDLFALADVLGDFKKRVGSDVVAVVGVDGRVIACAGDDRLRGIDLSASKLFVEASESKEARSNVWGFEDRVLAVAAKSVWLGEARMIGVVLIAEQLGDRVVREIAALTSLDAAMFVRDTLVLSTNPANAKLVREVAALGDNETATIAHGGARHVVRAEELSERALPARVLWMRRSRTTSGIEERALLYTPVIAAIVFGCAVAWRKR